MLFCRLNRLLDCKHYCFQFILASSQQIKAHSQKQGNIILTFITELLHTSSAMLNRISKCIILFQRIQEHKRGVIIWSAITGLRADSTTVICTVQHLLGRLPRRLTVAKEEDLADHGNQ